MRRTFDNTSYCDFKDGVLHGRCEVLYRRQKVSVVVPYMSGKVDGRLDAFGADGTRLGETYFQQGKLHGRSVMWYQDGTLMESGYFEDGQAQGVWTFWNTDGQVRMEGSFDGGKREGLWLYRDWTGEVYQVHCEKGACPGGFYLGQPTAQYVPQFLNRTLSGQLH
jgi:antitoxin component YwqK of YwqJK toxin-antitoxin module